MLGTQRANLVVSRFPRDLTGWQGYELEAELDTFLTIYQSILLPKLWTWQEKSKLTFNSVLNICEGHRCLHGLKLGHDLLNVIIIKFSKVERLENSSELFLVVSSYSIIQVFNQNGCKKNIRKGT